MLFATGIAGVLLYLANAGSLWAAVFFAVASLWLIYDHVATPIALSDIGSDMVDTLDRAYTQPGSRSGRMRSLASCSRTASSSPCCHDADSNLPGGR